MIDLEKTAHHRVYKTEVLGDALVVTLQGDAPGFAIGAVHNEMATLIGLAKQPEIQSLIVDMSGSNYYGSLILGEIVNLGQAVRDRGGRIALAGVSNDMHEILRMMRLDTMWERYPTRATALRALANIPLRQQLKPLAKPVAILAGVLLLAALVYLIPRRDYTADYYREVRAIWDEAAKMQALRPDDLEWQHFVGRAERKLDALAPRLDRIATLNNLTARNLLFAVRDHAPQALQKRLDPKDEQTIVTAYLLALVDSELNHTARPPRPPEAEKLLGPDVYNSDGSLISTTK